MTTTGDSDPTHRPIQVRELTIAICTNRLARAEKQLPSIAHCLRIAKQVLVVVDGRQGAAQLVSRMKHERINGRVEPLVTAPGLSACRNFALRACRTRFLLFLDDDAFPTEAAVREATGLLREGVAAVGARLVARPLTRFPWFINHGQYHLLGLHSPYAEQPAIWGAFMAIDTRFTAEHSLQFRSDLGRANGGLQSGDDSYFIWQIHRKGGTAMILKENTVIHDFCSSRLTMRYLVRRSWWQGRSEVRRRRSWSGVRKEFSRYFARPVSVGGAIAAAACLSSMIAGVLHEALINHFTRVPSHYGS